ncbi:response regulator transcription factor [Halopseudomonas nanhaiensis]|uniref:response regulator transcription factor n=1 Tax=Halopseudomonas nanhaiensis TaxID=2830842 RepID=UPI001CBD7806|nr:response regulator transcription factor [Halopseudomonas nanhaiensis]UAW98927.1 response regulator transcription factor [Halopseudomonas nanhaiensis]
MGAHLGRIMIIEDDSTLGDQLAQLLQGCGYATERYEDGLVGLDAALARDAQLILLDIKLPGLNGLSLLKRLREAKQTPVIMLTACGAEEERIRGLRHGADDYLAKPFNVEELTLRIDAVLRRSRTALRAMKTEPTQLQIGDLRLDRACQTVHVRQQMIDITPIQFRLLWQLVAQRGEALSKAYLYRLVFDRDYSRYDRSLEMHISRIRRRLQQAGLADPIQTLHGRGYVYS